MSVQSSPRSVRTGASIRIGDAQLDRVVDLDRFELKLRWLFPDADPALLEADRHWLEPNFMHGEIVALSIHSLVLRVGGRVVLIDTCVGEHKPRPRHPSWHERAATTYAERLAAVGLRAEDIDVVFCTHLHADHIGWNTQLLNGRWVPTFPNARYLMGRTELAYWKAELRNRPAEDVNHGSYADSILPVIERGKADLVDTDHEILDGLVVCALPGHTPGKWGCRFGEATIAVYSLEMRSIIPFNLCNRTGRAASAPIRNRRGKHVERSWPKPPNAGPGLFRRISWA